MRLLIDTNVFLEIILGQQRADEATALLAKTAEHEFFLSDYSLHSIGLLLLRRKQHDIFQSFLRDLTVNATVTLASLSTSDMPVVIDVARRYHLDFDDAYQYSVAKKFGLTLISFDSDFDRTDRGRKTPAEVLP